MNNLIRSQFLLPTIALTKCDGLPFYAEEILEGLRGIAGGKVVAEPALSKPKILRRILCPIQRLIINPDVKITSVPGLRRLCRLERAVPGAHHSDLDPKNVAVVSGIGCSGQACGSFSSTLMGSTACTAGCSRPPCGVKIGNPNSRSLPWAETQ